MAPFKKPAPRHHEQISKQRAVKASLITVLSVVLLLAWVYHAFWAVDVLSTNKYGDILSNVVFGVGTLVANAGLSVKLVAFLTEKYLDGQIDADHKKYL